MLRRLVGRRRPARDVSSLTATASKLVSPAETVPERLPLNIARKSDLPADRMDFGFSFQDVPGLRLSECRLYELDDCEIECVLDDWDSVFIDVSKHGKIRGRFRGAGVPSGLTMHAAKRVLEGWERAALPLEIWSGNYGHWIAYHLPKLLSFIDHGWKDHIVLPERGRWHAVEQRDRTFLSLLDPSVGGHLTLRQGVTRVGRLALIDGDPHHAGLLRRVSNRIRANLPETPVRERRRLYISRSDAGYRKLTNEGELIAGLRELGFEAIALGSLPIAQQIGAFSNAECVVGMHGSGLANMLFCPEIAKIVEVIADDFPCPDFYRLATTIGLDYYLMSGKSIGDAKPGYRDMVAPVDSIIGILKDIL